MSQFHAGSLLRTGRGRRGGGGATVSRGGRRPIPPCGPGRPAVAVSPPAAQNNLAAAPRTRRQLRRCRPKDRSGPVLRALRCRPRAVDDDSPASAGRKLPRRAETQLAPDAVLAFAVRPCLPAPEGGPWLGPARLALTGVSYTPFHFINNSLFPLQNIIETKEKKKRITSLITISH